MLVSGCSAPKFEGPSADTEFLRNRLLPRLVEWAKTRERTLTLAPLVQGRGYDYLCLVLPPSEISDIGAKLSRPVTAYHSDSDRFVLDGFALVAVRGDEAHSILVRRSALALTVNPDVGCYRVTDSILKRQHVEHSHATHAALTRK